MAIHRDYTYEAAYTASTTEPAASNVLVWTTSKAAPVGAPNSNAASLTTPLGTGATSMGALSPINHLPVLYNDAHLNASSIHNVIDSISVPTDTTWAFVPARKKKNKKKIKEAKAKSQVIRQPVADGGQQLLPGAKFSVQSQTSGRVEQTQLQVPHQAAPAMSEGSRPFCHRKPRGKRAGKLAANRHAIITTNWTPKKRSWPPENTNGPPFEKRARMETTTRDSYTAAFKDNELCVAVITEPFNELTVEQAHEVKTCLETKLIDDLLNPSTAAHMARVGFRGKAHYNEAVLKIRCQDNVALEWLRRALENIPSPIPGSKLVVRPQSEIQRRILCGLFVPEITLDLDTIRRVLTVSNRKTVDIGSWTLVKAEKQPYAETPGIYMLLRIPESDVMNLIKQERRIYWLLGNIYVRILGEESRMSSTVAVPRVLTLAPTHPGPELTTQALEAESIDTVCVEKIKEETDDDQDQQ